MVSSVIERRLYPSRGFLDILGLRPKQMKVFVNALAEDTEWLLIRVYTYLEVYICIERRSFIRLSSYAPRSAN